VEHFHLAQLSWLGSKKRQPSSTDTIELTLLSISCVNAIILVKLLPTETMLAATCRVSVRKVAMIMGKIFLCALNPTYGLLPRWAMVIVQPDG